MERLNQYVEKLINLDWINIGLSIAIFLVFLVFRKMFTTLTKKLVLGLSKRSSTKVIRDVLKSYEKPLRFLFVIIGTYLACNT